MTKAYLCARRRGLCLGRSGAFEHTRATRTTWRMTQALLGALAYGQLTITYHRVQVTVTVQELNDLLLRCPLKQRMQVLPREVQGRSI